MSGAKISTEIEEPLTSAEAVACWEAEQERPITSTEAVALWELEQKFAAIAKATA